MDCIGMDANTEHVGQTYAVGELRVSLLDRDLTSISDINLEIVPSL